MKAFPLRSDKTRMALSLLLFNIEFLATATRKKKKKGEIICIQIKMEEINLLPFADDMMLYMEDPRDSTKNPLELIHEFSKVLGYKYIQFCCISVHQQQTIKKKKN